MNLENLTNMLFLFRKPLKNVTTEKYFSKRGAEVIADFLQNKI